MCAALTATLSHTLKLALLSEMSLFFLWRDPFFSLVLSGKRGREEQISETHKSMDSNNDSGPSLSRVSIDLPFLNDAESSFIDLSFLPINVS